jgi:hypothetical protein
VSPVAIVLKFVPVMITVVPKAALSGAMDMIVGADGPLGPEGPEGPDRLEEPPDLLQPDSRKASAIKTRPVTRDKKTTGRTTLKGE